MSWKYCAGNYYFPPFLGYPGVMYELWRGAGADAGYYLYNHSAFGWVISASFGPVFSISGAKATHQITSINSYTYHTVWSYDLWAQLGGETFIGIEFYAVTQTNGRSGRAGIPLSEEWIWNDPEDHSKGGRYNGATFWSSSSLPAIGQSIDFVQRGFLRGAVQNAFNGTPLTVACTFNRWIRKSGGRNTYSSEPYGEYEYIGEGTQPNKIVGLPCWRSQSGKEYIRSLSTVNDKYSYGDVSYNSTVGKWVIGMPNKAEGWWEGTEPSKTAAVTFVFKKPEGSKITGTDITLTFFYYLPGNNTETISLAEAALWK